MSDRIISRPSSEAYRESWDRIWGAKPAPKDGDHFMLGGMECVVDEGFCARAGFDIVMVPKSMWVGIDVATEPDRTVTWDRSRFRRRGDGLR